MPALTSDATEDGNDTLHQGEVEDLFSSSDRADAVMDPYIDLIAKLLPEN